jgi:ABC-type phosphate/phosphonate transport system substrate-binding protein
VTPVAIVANARMYSPSPAAAAAWRTLLEWVIAHAQVAGAVLEYPPPQPLPSLWSRADLGCAFMCGFPLSRAQPQPTVLAAPVPSPPAYGGLARYRSHIVALAAGPLRGIADTLGRRMAYTTPDSQSGYQGPRRYFAAEAHSRGRPLFAAMVGPLVTPRRVVEAVLAGEADAGPVDSYAFDLLQRHEPALVAPLLVLASTAWTPIPPLVGAADLDPASATRLRHALLDAGRATQMAAVRDALLLDRFVPAAAGDYRPLAAQAAQADALGYRQFA